MTLQINAIEAPKWFIEGRESSEKFEKELMSLMGLSWDKMKKTRQKLVSKSASETEFMIETLQMQLRAKKDLSPEARIKCILLQSITSNYSQYLWDRFRLENLMNDFGVAEELTYDAVNKIIKIVKGREEINNPII